VFGTPFAAQRGGLGDTPQRTHEQAEAQQPIERDGQRLKCGAFHYWFNPAHLKLSYNHITMMMVVALILMFRSISTCCPFSVCVCVCVLRCGCHARLASVLACQCLDQLILINQHLKGVIPNGHTQHRTTHGAGLRAVECFYCCVLDLDHSVFLSVVVVSHECIIPNTSPVVKPTHYPIVSNPRLWQ